MSNYKHYEFPASDGVFYIRVDLENQKESIMVSRSGDRWLMQKSSFFGTPNGFSLKEIDKEVFDSLVREIFKTIIHE